jgi:DNA-binding transcriptional LysR family regulator
MVAMAATIPAATAVDLNQVSTFVQVMESGSFTAAARALGLPKSSVSRRVSALERSLRLRLLQRSTRKLVLTEAGRLYFERARAALGGLADAGAAAADRSREIAGPIRFTTGGDNTGLVAALIAEFVELYPGVQIDVVLTPRRVDLVTEGFDLALRAGPLVDSSLIVRRLGRSDLGLFAARGYLRKAGTPRRLSDLAQHRFVLFGEPHDRQQLRLTGPEGPSLVKIDGPLVVHEMSFATDVIAAGVGIGLVPEVYFGWAHQGGLRSAPLDLVRVLPDHAAAGPDVSLVSPPTTYEPARVRLFRDFLATRLQPLMQSCTLAIEEQKRARLLQAVERTATAPAAAPRREPRSARAPAPPRPTRRGRRQG